MLCRRLSGTCEGGPRWHREASGRNYCGRGGGGVCGVPVCGGGGGALLFTCSFRGGPWFYTALEVVVRGVGGGTGQLSTVGVVVSDGSIDSRRRLLRTLDGRNFRLARTALSHSLGRLGMTGTTGVGNGCMCILPGGVVCGHSGSRDTDRVLVADKFISLRFSNGVTIVHAQPKCTDDVTCSVSGQRYPTVLNAVTKSSAVVLIIRRTTSRSRMHDFLSRVVPGVG